MILQTLKDGVQSLQIEEHLRPLLLANTPESWKAAAEYVGPADGPKVGPTDGQNSRSYRSKPPTVELRAIVEAVNWLERRRSGKAYHWSYGDPIRIMPGPTKWYYPNGEAPTIYLHVIIKGNESYSYTGLDEDCLLEMDGVWYGWAGPLTADQTVDVLAPKLKWAIHKPILLNDGWARLPESSAGGERKWGERLRLQPGPHTLRILFRPGADGGTAQGVSDPFHIEVGPSFAVDPALQFGPEHEAAVYFRDRTGGLKLGTDEFVHYWPAEREHYNPIIDSEWRARSEVEFLPGDLSELYFPGGAAVSLEQEDWGKAPSEVLKKLLQQAVSFYGAPPEQQVAAMPRSSLAALLDDWKLLLPRQSSDPDVWVSDASSSGRSAVILFRTRQNKIGLMQITKYDSQPSSEKSNTSSVPVAPVIGGGSRKRVRGPDGVRIRYKFIQTPGTIEEVSPAKEDREKALRAELELVRQHAAQEEERFSAGLISPRQLLQAKGYVEILEAELTGDPVQAASVRVRLAQQYLDDISASIPPRKGVWPVWDYEDSYCKDDLAIAQARLRDAEARRARESKQQ
jgi:hypothetical protein